MPENPFCVRCSEEFPVRELATEGARMGSLYPFASFVHPVIRQQRFPIDSFLCGNCYFDLTDDAD